jgi:hypothetical protein
MPKPETTRVPINRTAVMTASTTTATATLVNLSIRMGNTIPPNDHIGDPQLLTGAEWSPLGSSAKATVNNCASAPVRHDRIRMVQSFHFGYPLPRFPAPTGQVFERPVASTTVSFIDRPAGAA